MAGRRRSGGGSGVGCSGGALGLGGGVGAGVDGAQGGDGRFGVDGGGLGAGVAEELLDEAAVRAVFEHVYGAGMAEKMAASGFGHPGGVHGAAHPVAEVGRAEALAVAAEEKRGLGRIEQEAGAGGPEVAGQPFEGARADGHHAAPAALAAADVQGGARRVEVVEVEPDEFAAARAGGVEGFENGAVSDAQRVGDVGDGEHGGDFLAAQSAGKQAVGFAGQFEVGGRVGGEAVLPAEMGEEALQGAEPGALGGDPERLAVLLAVAPEPALEAFEDGPGDLFGAEQVAGLGPMQEGVQRPLVGFESARAGTIGRLTRRLKAACS